MVTGSGFDFIQTAVMKVDGNNMTAVEVYVSSVPFLLLLFIVVGFFTFRQVVFLSPHVFAAYFICGLLSPQRQLPLISVHAVSPLA